MREGRSREFGDWTLDHAIGVSIVLAIILIAAGFIAVHNSLLSSKSNQEAVSALKKEPIIQRIGSPCRTQLRKGGPLSLLESDECTAQSRALVLVTCEQFPSLRDQPFCTLIFRYFGIKLDDLINIDHHASVGEGGDAHSPQTGNQLPEGFVAPPNQATRIAAAQAQAGRRRKVR